jgi:hypothetical protein
MVYDVADHLSQLRSRAVKGSRNFSCLTAPGDFDARATAQTVFPWRLYPRLGSRRRRLTVIVGTAHRIQLAFKPSEHRRNHRVGFTRQRPCIASFR